MKRAAALTITLALAAISVGGCKAAKKLFLGDPDTVPTVRPPGPTVTSATLAIPLPTPPPPPKQLRLPDGSLSSPEYAEAAEAKALGQMWRAHLTLESKALGETGTKDELRLLRDICVAQGDDDCVAKCAARLGERRPETELEKLQKLAVKNPKAARVQLEDKLANGSATEQEVALLHKLCQTARDKACLEKTAPKPPTPAGTASTQDDAAKARALMNKDPKAARALLEPKAAAGKASKEELAVLCAMCTLSDDGLCLKRHCAK